MNDEWRSRLSNLFSYVLAVLLAAMIIGMAVLTVEMILNGV